MEVCFEPLARALRLSHLVEYYLGASASLVSDVTLLSRSLRSADRMVQQLGRSHRANQTSAPQYRFLISKAPGEPRCSIN